MSNESQVETESDAPQGRPSPRATLFAGPFGVVAAVIALGVVIGAAVFVAVGSDDSERAAFEPRSLEDRASSQDAIAEWRSVIDSGAIAASLDDTELSWSELEGMLERLPAGSPVYTGVPNLETTRQVVRQWMITLALEDELAARGIESVAADRQAALDETALADPTFDETTPYGSGEGGMFKFKSMFGNGNVEYAGAMRTSTSDARARRKMSERGRSLSRGSSAKSVNGK